MSGSLVAPVGKRLFRTVCQPAIVRKGRFAVSDWGQGYQVDIPYTRGFYPELAPAHLEAALLFAGFGADLTRPGTRYCELGCGYGLTTLILAAANPQIS